MFSGCVKVKSHFKGKEMLKEKKEGINEKGIKDGRLSVSMCVSVVCVSVVCGVC